MFSFLLKFQAFFERFKKNKGLFFTTLTTSSFVVIVLSLYYLGSVAQRTASTVYEEERLKVLKLVDNELISKSEKLLPIALITASRADLLDALLAVEAEPVVATDENQRADTNTTVTTTVVPEEKIIDEKRVLDIISALLKEVSAYSTSSMDVEVYDKNTNIIADAKLGVSTLKEPTTRASIIQVVAKGEPLIGIEQIEEQTVLRAIVPIKNGGETIEGALEIRQDLSFLTDVLKEQGYELIFVLDRFSFPSDYFKDLRVQDINDRYITIQKNVDTNFFGFLSALDFKGLIDKEYMLEDDFFVTYKMVQDVEGATFGMMLLGENLDKPTSVVNIVGSAAKTITTVALGLVVALLLFMI